MKYATNRRINVRTIRNIQNGEGLTLRNGKIVEYKTGWQVGITGITCKTPEEVSALLHHGLGRHGNVGIWFNDGIYYIDISKRIATKKMRWQLARQPISRPFMDGDPANMDS